MAIFTTGPAVGAISGDLGGVSFANPRGSKVIRKKRRSSHNPPPAGRYVRAFAMFYVKAWARQDFYAKIAWSTFAVQHPIPNRLGISRQLSAFNMFVKFNASKHVFDLGTNIMPPEGKIEQALSRFILTSSVIDGIDLAFTDSFHPNDVNFTAYLGNPMRSTIPKFVRDWIWAEALTSTTQTVSLDDPWEASWPLPALGQLVAVRVIPTDANQFLPGAPIDLYTLTTA